MRGEGRSRPFVTRVQGCTLALEPRLRQLVGVGVEFDVVDAEFLPAVDLLEHGLGDPCRPAVVVDGVRFEFDADGVVTRVDPTGPTVTNEAQCLVGDAAVELDPRLGVERLSYPRDQFGLRRRVVGLRPVVSVPCPPGEISRHRLLSLTCPLRS